MKKNFAIILAAALAFSLCGCAELDKLKNVELPPLPEATEKQPEQTAPAVEATAVIDASASEAYSKLPNHVIVGIEKQSEEHYDPQNGTTLILTFSYETPMVYIEGRDEATQAVNEYIATLDETYYTGNSYGIDTDISGGGMNGMLEMATDNYSYAVENNMTDIPLEYSSLRSVSVSRVDSRVLSLVYNTQTYTGGAHGNYFYRAYSFDTETGELITLDTLSEGHDGFSDFAAQYLMSLYENDTDGYYSERVNVDMLTDGDVNAALTALVREGSWYFGADGLTFFSDPYELGPYAVGVVEFTIPYSELKGQIDDKWLIPERTEDGGKLELKAQSDVADGSIEIIDKVIADEGQEQLCLEAVGTIYDVRLSRVAYYDSFYETAQLWAGSYMSDCALQLVTLIPDGLPALMVSYRNAAGEQTRLLLSQSGENGSYILIGDNIEAVG